MATVSSQFHLSQFQDPYNNTVLFLHHWQNGMEQILWSQSHKEAASGKDNASEVQNSIIYEVL